MPNKEELGPQLLRRFGEQQSYGKSDQTFLRKVVIGLTKSSSNMGLLNVPVRIREIKDPRDIIIAYENYSPNKTMVLYSFPRGIQNAQNCSTYSSPPPDLSHIDLRNLGFLGNPLRNVFINEAIGPNLNNFREVLQRGARISSLQGAKDLFEAAFALINYDMRSCTNVFFNVRPRLYSKEALRELFIAIEI
ncbi:MAG: hypothetical protein QXF76_00350 [Candidatus Anstonellales archaeon]